MSESSVDQQSPIEDLPRAEKLMSSDVHQRFSDPGSSIVDEQKMHKHLAFAVHEALLDSDFVSFDPVSGSKTDRFHFPADRFSPVSVCYSLPKLLSFDNDSGPNLIDYVVVKFDTLRGLFLVYGSLVKEGSGGLYTLFLRANRSKTDYNFASLNSGAEKKIFKFRNIVMDGFVLPLLSDLSFSTGLPLPACLMSLPPDLKLTILESLPDSDVSSMSCVCSELQNMVLSNDALKKKIKQPRIWRMGFPVGFERPRRLESCYIIVIVDNQYKKSGMPLTVLFVYQFTRRLLP